MEGKLPSDSLQTGPSDPLDLSSTRAPVQTSRSSFFDASSLNLDISAEEQSNMMKSIQEIFELEEEQTNEEEQMRDEDEEEPPVDLEDQQRRTEKLKGVLSTLAQLWWSDSDHMDLAAEKLADGSRDRKLIFCRLCVYSPPFTFDLF